MKNKKMRCMTVMMSMAMMISTVFTSKPEAINGKSVLQNVNASDTLSVNIKSQKIVACNSEITIYMEITGTVPSDAWIGIVPSDVGHTEKEADAYDSDYCYFKNAKDGIVNLKTPSKPGNYDIRVYNGDNSATASEVTYLSIIVTNEISDIPEVTLLGDVNEDGKFNVADIVLLKKWLLAVPDIKLANWKNGDLCNDNIIDVFDLCLMRYELVEKNIAPEVISSNFNTTAVKNKPVNPSVTFTATKDCKLHSILTYHWNEGNGKKSRTNQPS